jgi:hypothetical protein
MSFVRGEIVRPSEPGGKALSDPCAWSRGVGGRAAVGERSAGGVACGHETESK